MDTEPNGCIQARLVVLTSIQWFYAPTWGTTLVLCHGHKPKPPCVQWEQLHARQLELTEVLRRNVLHPLVAEVHVLVGESKPVHEYLQQLPWYRELSPCKRVELVQIRGRPTFASYLAHANTHLRNRLVVLSNQDVFLADGWESLPAMLLPGEAFVLSRYHAPVAYQAGPGREALTRLNLTQAGAGPDWMLRGRYVPPKVLTSTVTCRMGAAFAQSTCIERNYGAYDAYVFVLRQRLSEQQLALFDFPQNAWGGENLVVYLFRHGLELRVRNPCRTLRVVHVHCQMRSINTQGANTRVAGDERLTRKKISTKAMQRLASLGVSVMMPNVLNANESCPYHCHRRKCPCLAPPPSVLSRVQSIQPYI